MVYLPDILGFGSDISVKEAISLLKKDQNPSRIRENRLKRGPIPGESDQGIR